MIDSKSGLGDPRPVLRALSLALGQLGDPQILRVLAKTVAITLGVFLLLGVVLYFALSALLAWWAPHDVQGWSWLLAVILWIALAWLLWRVVAVAVLQFHADEVVEAVERKHYPAALASARKLSFREEMTVGLRGAKRAVLINLAAMPVALLLLFTGVGTPLVFWAVNAVLLGRELTELVWLRHRHSPDAPPPLSQAEQLALGGLFAALFLVPFVNLLAPVLGAATATHRIHRRAELARAI